MRYEYVQLYNLYAIKQSSEHTYLTWLLVLLFYVFSAVKDFHFSFSSKTHKKFTFLSLFTWVNLIFCTIFQPLRMYPILWKFIMNRWYEHAILLFKSIMDLRRLWNINWTIWDPYYVIRRLLKKLNLAIIIVL